LAYISAAESISVTYLQPLLRNRSEFDESTVRLGITPFKVIQGHRV